MLAAWGFLLLSSIAAISEPRFVVQQTFIDGVPVVRLKDSTEAIEVTILPSIGNMASEMRVHGNNILFFPEVKLADLQKNPMQFGIPILAPWANRMDDVGFWVNRKRYNFDMTIGNIRRDNHGLPIHGLLSGSVWEVTHVFADKRSASVTSRFEFSKHRDLMVQWPFAHTYEMTYRLADGALEVRTTVTNLGVEPMPVALGFHPYYRIPGISRDQWLLRMPARSSVITDNKLIPTGELRSVDLPSPLPLKDRTLDDGFTDLERDARGRASFKIQSGDKEIELLFGPKYPVAVVWQPALQPGQSMGFICIEPMTGVTNAINLHHAGKYPGLQMIASGNKWTESFWIRPKGF